MTKQQKVLIFILCAFFFLVGRATVSKKTETIVKDCPACEVAECSSSVTEVEYSLLKSRCNALKIVDDAINSEWRLAIGYCSKGINAILDGDNSTLTALVDDINTVTEHMTTLVGQRADVLDSLGY